MSRPVPEAAAASASATRCALAARVLDAGALGDIHAVAVTGSAARGDASDASDLDLWAVADHCRPPWDGVVDNTPVTCFFETDDLLEDLTHLITVEAEHVVVLIDERGDFKRARALALEKKETLERACRTNLHAHIRADVHQSTLPGAASWDALITMRRIAKNILTLAALSLGARRLLKVRQVRGTFGAPAYTAYTQALGLRDLDDGATLLAQWAKRPALLRAATRVGFDFGSLDEQAVSNSATARKLNHGEIGDGVLAAREWFSRILIGPLTRRGYTHDDLFVGDPLPKTLRSDMAMWFGVPSTGDMAIAVSKARAATQALIGALAERGALTPEDVRLLGTFAAPH